jgi:hypothetical protein
VRTTTRGVVYSVQDASELVGIRPGVLLQWMAVGTLRIVSEISSPIPEQYFFTESDIKRLMSAIAASVESKRAKSRPKILTWSPKTDDGLHYGTEQLARAWGLSSHIVHKMFENESGVLRLIAGDPEQTRCRVTLRIPSDVVLRVRRRLCDSDGGKSDERPDERASN